MTTVYNDKRGNKAWVASDNACDGIEMMKNGAFETSWLLLFFMSSTRLATIAVWKEGLAGA